MSKGTLPEEETDDVQRRLDDDTSRPRQLARWLLISRDQVKIDSPERLSRHSFSASTIQHVVGSVLSSSLSMLAAIKTLIPRSFCSDERLQTKFAWLREYRSDVHLWCSWHAMTDASLDLVRRVGYCEATSTAIGPLLAPHCDSEPKRRLAGERIVRVEHECSKVPSGSRMPGSTEILESSFGKLTSLEGSQSKSGFTSYILVWAALFWGALFGDTTMDTIKAAMVSTPTKLVQRWVGENLGLTVQSKRTQFARILRTKSTGKPQET